MNITQAKNELDEILLTFYLTARDDGTTPYSQETKQQAKAAIASYTAKQVIEARIDENKRINRNYIMGKGWTDTDKRYERGRNDQIAEITELTYDRIKELEQTRKDLGGEK